MTAQITLRALHGIPLIAPGDDLAKIITDGLADNKLDLQSGDVLVVAQKIVSKSQGRIVDLRTVTPGERASELALACDKDPRLVELILGESSSVIRQVPGVLITEHRNGWIMANAGIDASNVDNKGPEENVLLLPENPDRTCAELRHALQQKLGVQVGVVISDSFGRPWRLGTTGVAIGAAGLASLWDRRGEHDMFGRELKVSQQAVADELAAAASLLQGQGSEGRPIVLISGFGALPAAAALPCPASALIRNETEDLFR